MAGRVSKASPGQPFRPLAREWNAFADAANYLRDIGGPNLTGEPGAPRFSAGVVWVRNDNPAGSMGMFDAVRLGGLVSGDPSENELSSSGPSSQNRWTPQDSARLVFSATSAAPDPHAAFAILQQPLRPGQIGRAVASGIACAEVLVRHKGHRYASTRSASPFLDASSPGRSFTLVSDTWGGARILWQPPGVGLLPCVLLLGDFRQPQPAAAFHLNGSELTVCFETTIRPGGVGTSSYVRTFKFHLDAGAEIRFAWRGDVVQRTPVVWFTRESATPANLAAETAQRSLNFAGINTNDPKYTRIVCAVWADPATGQAVWTTRPPEQIAKDMPPPPIRYNENNQTLGWNSLGGGWLLAIPPGTDSNFYAAGNWGADPVLTLNPSGYNWNRKLGKIATDASGNIAEFEHDSPERASMVRYSTV